MGFYADTSELVRILAVVLRIVMAILMRKEKSPAALTEAARRANLPRRSATRPRRRRKRRKSSLAD